MACESTWISLIIYYKKIIIKHICWQKTPSICWQYCPCREWTIKPQPHTTNTKCFLLNTNCILYLTSHTSHQSYISPVSKVSDLESLMYLTSLTYFTSLLHFTSLTSHKSHISPVGYHMSHYYNSSVESQASYQSNTSS